MNFGRKNSASSSKISENTFRNSSTFMNSRRQSGYNNNPMMNNLAEA